MFPSASRAFAPGTRRYARSKAIAIVLRSVAPDQGGLPQERRSSSEVRSPPSVLNEDENTVSTLTSPIGQSITLIGTAHLSKKSNEQVQRLIEEINPNVVMVEIDPSRLHRIGIKSLDDIKVKSVVTSEDIDLPARFVKRSETRPPWFIMPLIAAQQLVVEGFTRVARAMLTGMYNDMNDKINEEGDFAGGEFLVAIRAAENCTSCHKLVLGDRSSLTTIKRAAELAMESGDPLGVLRRLQDANGEAMGKLETKVREEIKAKTGSEDVDESEFQIAMMEKMKEDSKFRDGLFQTLEDRVPEFTQAFLRERDYIMSEAMRRELLVETNQRVVGVVGLAHLPGIEEHLNESFDKAEMALHERITSRRRFS